MTVDRRQFLRRSGAAALSAGTLGAAGTARATGRPGGDPLQLDGPLQLARGADAEARLPAVSFHGAHQPGIVTAPPPAACFASFDVIAERRGELIGLLRTLTAISRFLTAGGTPADLGTGAPPSDSGTLGPMVPADGLTITVGFGSKLFDERFGLAARRPIHLTEMTSFPNDNLDPAQTGGDLLLQICAGSADTAIHALRAIAKHTRGVMQIRWRLDGFVSPPRPAGVPRNHLGFKDGIANPDIADPALARRLLWVTRGIGEPRWAVGGSYHVCRIIKCTSSSGTASR
jgi:deferrochelatase/peroxidase EfeB